MHNFTIKTYGVSELAQLYFPKISKQSACNQFRIWISNNKKLSNDLLNLGHLKRQKIFTPKQVAAIICAFGEP